MATEIKDMGLKAQAKVLNKVALEVGGDLVNIALKNGEASQRVLAKVLKGGITIFGMQQKLALAILEKVTNKVKEEDKLNKVVDQYTKYYNTAKETALKNPTIATWAEKAEEAKGELTKAINKFTKKAEGVEVKIEVKEAVEAADAIADKVEAELAELVETTEEAATELVEAVVETTEEAATEIVEAVAETTEEVVVEAVEAVETIVEETEKAVEATGDDLKQINGVGPKTADILLTAGFDTFQKLANASEETVKAALEAAGTSYKKFNPAPWIQETKTLV